LVVRLEMRIGQWLPAAFVQRPSTRATIEPAYGVVTRTT
jgi:hypothetical protein